MRKTSVLLAVLMGMAFVLAVAGVVDLLATYDFQLGHASASGTTRLGIGVILAFAVNGMILVTLLFASGIDTLTKHEKLSAVYFPILGSLLCLITVILISAGSSYDQLRHNLTPTYKWSRDPDVRIFSVIMLSGAIACDAWFGWMVLEGRGVRLRVIIPIYASAVGIVIAIILYALRG